MTDTNKPESNRGRGALSSPPNRFLKLTYVRDTDADFDEEVSIKTELLRDTTQSIIAHNDSPDVGFSTSVNPYRGCEHGCIYCYARPSHAYLELSPGLDFETKLFAKTNAAEQLRAELGRPDYRPSPIALGANTDCY